MNSKYYENLEYFTCSNKLDIFMSEVLCFYYKRSKLVTMTEIMFNSNLINWFCKKKLIEYQF